MTPLGLLEVSGFLFVLSFSLISGVRAGYVVAAALILFMVAMTAEVADNPMDAQRVTVGAFLVLAVGVILSVVGKIQSERVAIGRPPLYVAT